MSPRRTLPDPELLLGLLGRGKEHACHGRDLIGSTPQQGGGYYLISSVGELEDTARHLVSRVRRMFTTLSAMRASAARVFGPEQERLFEVGA